MDDYIRVYDHVLDEVACRALIQEFEDNHQKHQEVKVEEKDLLISFDQITLEPNSSMSQSYLKLMNDYFVHYQLDVGIEEQDIPNDYSFEAVRIKRYLSNDYDRFDDHVDVRDYDTSRRFLAFFVYLNDVNEGGETEFIGLPKRGSYIQYKIEPKMGRMIVFPPMWPWPHKGHKPVSGKKYLLHSYLHYV